MSEEKIIQHAGKALHVMQNKEIGLLQKIREFLGEILIIVIAVSLTLLFHNWNDQLHERRLAKEFLAGIRDDLSREARILERADTDYQATIDYYEKVRTMLATGKIDAPYLDTNSFYLRNTLYFVPDNSRFEGFKSSGYLRLIEDQTLLKHMMNMYSISIPFQQSTDKYFFELRASDYATVIRTKDVLNFSGSSQSQQIYASRLVNDPAFRYHIFRFSGDLEERKQQKLDLAKDMRQLAAEVDQELNK